MVNTTAAYIAGAMDADGYFTIKKSTYHQRVCGDAKNPVYSESAGLRQVTPQVPYLLKETFGGGVYVSKGHSENSKPLYNYRATDQVAVALCEAVTPYLLIKPRQAALLLELRTSKAPKYQQHAYWFEQQCPDWQTMEMLTASDVAAMLGYANNHSVVSRAIANGTLVALPLVRSGAIAQNRFPRPLIDRLMAHMSNGNYTKPIELMEWRERLYQEVRELNKIGINGTSVYYRTGAHEPA